VDDELFVCGEELRERLIALDFALLVYFWVGGLMFQILGVMGDLHAWAFSLIHCIGIVSGLS